MSVEYLNEFIEKNWSHYLEFLRCEVAAKDPALTETYVDSLTDADAEYRYDSLVNRTNYALRYEENYRDFWVDMKHSFTEKDWFDREEA